MLDAAVHDVVGRAARVAGPGCDWLGAHSQARPLQGAQAQPICSNYAAKFVLTVNAFLLLLWGIMPQTVIDWCAKALENTL